MLYAEHTWGHSSTITNPYDTMVLNLDMRKNSYASKAHEAASLMLCSIAEKKGDMLRYYNTTGAVRAVGVSLYGLDSIFTFAFPLMMGMLSGVYTSLCVSTSAWVLWNDRKSKKAETKKA